MMSALISDGNFLASITHGWTLSSIATYVGCVVFTQFSGAMWYGLIFGKVFVKLAYPQVKTDDDWKRLQADFNPSVAHGSALIGSMISVLLQRALYHAFEVTASAVDGLALGLVIVMIDATFGIMHPFFEDRPMKLYIMHKCYHSWCLGIVGAVIGSGWM